ncbi:vertnin [Echinops telfairi]|uniref:Vertnin n=2 Tax=Echinops telfairi TaxID=9371 RepID=A0AC55CX35_ECHTE|nr:vertnin [Echinops telfairi]XP_045144060.1 vertnin [Echinops telfairi]
MTSRDQLVLRVLQELQEAVESEGLEGLVGTAIEAKQVLSSFTLPQGRDGGPSPQVLEVDSVALSLYPEDAPRNMLPLACKGEGSLLFEAASMLLWGDAGLSLELRARTVVEMLLHRQYYLQGMIDSKVMLQAVRYSLCSEESPEMTSLPSATLEAIFDADVKATCFPSSFSNVWHLYALASVLQRNIYSIYPMRNLKIRPYFNRVIRPRRCDHVPSTLHIMWAGQPLTNHLFRHQYFAPVVGMEEVEAESVTSLVPARAALPPPAKTLELLNHEPGLSYSHLCERYNVTKSTFYRWRRQSQEHRLKVAARFSAKHFLQDSFHRGGVVPLQQFLQRFPDISRSTYYAWKNELLGMGTGACQALPAREARAGQELEEAAVEEQQRAQELGCPPPPASSPGVVFMQRAKLYLEHCISLNTLVPYRCFKRRFPGISRSTYYNWRRKALRRNPNFKPAQGLEAPGPPPTASLWEEPPSPGKQGEVVEVATEVTGGVAPAPRKRLPPRAPRARWQRRLRRAARKLVQNGLPFCRFRLRYPSLSPSTFWAWKSLAPGWPRSLSKSLREAPALGKGGGPEAKGKPRKEASWWAATATSPTEVRQAGPSPREVPNEVLGGPSQERAVAQDPPHGGSSSSCRIASGDGQVLVMDMITTTKFKAQAKLFLQKRFQSKSFPSYKEFSALFPFTARSTYYMWKRALYDGLTLVDG